MFGDQHQLFAFLFIGQGDHRMQGITPELANGFFNRRERHHFTGDLGEAFGTATDMYVAFGIDVNNIAGVVPAFTQLTHRRYKFAGLIMQQIPQHDVWSLYVQAATVVHAGHILKLVFDTR